MAVKFHDNNSGEWIAPGRLWMIVYFSLSKFISAFLFPPGIQILTIALSLALLRKWRRTAYFAIVVSAASLYAMSITLVTGPMEEWLEQASPEVKVADAPAAEAIVVLGDFVRVATKSRERFRLTASTDRLYKAALLYRAGKAQQVVVSGGTQSEGGNEVSSQAAAARELLIGWGVPAPAILLEAESQNTHENAVFSRRLFKAAGKPKILLVTSAMHLPRAGVIFRREGFDVVAFPADFKSGWGDSDWLSKLLPGAGNMESAGGALHEYLGMLVYKLRGWA